MRVDKAGTEVRAACVDLVFAAVAAYADDGIFIERYIGPNNLAGEHVYHIRVFDGQCGLPREGRVDQLVLFHGLCPPLSFSLSRPRLRSSYPLARSAWRFHSFWVVK